MRIIKLIKRQINDIEPSADVLKAIKAQCGIVVNAKAKIPLFRSPLFRLLAPIMSCFLLAVTCASVIFAVPKNSSTTSYVLLDLGSQVQFVTNDDSVVGQQALNVEAQILLLGCDYVNQNIDDAILDVVQNAEQLGMIEDGDSISIATVVDSNVEHEKKSSLLNRLNTTQDILGDSYELTCSYSGKENFVNSVASKYACSYESILDKDVIDLMKIYVNYDSAENQKYEYTLNNEYENLWEQNQSNMNADSQYISYKDLADNLNIIITNIELLQNDFDQKICDAVGNIIEEINGNYDNMLGDFQLNDEFLRLVKDKSQFIKEELNGTMQSYYDQFSKDIQEFKRNLYDAFINQGTTMQSVEFSASNVYTAPDVHTASDAPNLSNLQLVA